MKYTSPPAPFQDRDELEKTFETLKRDIDQLQLEHDLLKRAIELLKKGLSVNLRLLSNGHKVLLVAALKDSYSLSALLVTLNLPRNSYFYHRANLRAAEKYADVRRSMAELFEQNYRCYGYRRMGSPLRRMQLCLSEKVVRPLMKQAQLVAATAKARRYGSYLGQISPAPDNLSNRDFQADAPNAKWLTDITEFHIPAGKGFFGRLNNELFYPRNWRDTTIEHFSDALNRYIKWSNEKRIKTSLGSLSPIEYRRSLGLAT
jgi:putative transposase